MPAQTSDLHAPPALPAHLTLVFVGHVDHGKSTLIGRLLFDTGSVAEGKYEQIQAACKAEGMEFEYAFLLDALLEEQAQNITMDTTRVPFRTAKRAFTIIDAPGHKEFLKNMITGAASADAAILLVDANEGVREQSRRHAYLLSLLGLKHVIVVVNKMDLVGYAEAAFARVRGEIVDYLGQFGVKPDHVLPVSAKTGEGVAAGRPHMSWHQGPTLIEALEALPVRTVPSEAPLRVSVQDVYKFDSRRIVAGVVDAGTLRVGDAVEFHPGGKRTRVKTIEVFAGLRETNTVVSSSEAATAPRGSRTDGAKTLGDAARTPHLHPGADLHPHSHNCGDVTKSLVAGQTFAITLEDEIFVERGNVGAAPEHPPIIEREFTGKIFWLHPQPLRVGETFPLRLATQQVDATLVAVTRVIDPEKLDASHLSSDGVQRNQIAEVKVRAGAPLVFDLNGSGAALRRFVIVRNDRIGGGGVIEAAATSTTPRENLPIPLAARQALLGHRGAVLWLTGLSGAGKSTLATAVERRLLREGVLPVILDGDVLRAGLCTGLGFSDADRRENIRRAAEAALLVAESGAVVITALISPFRSDRQLVAERCEARGVAFAEVFVNAPLAECERRDPKRLYRRARAGEIKAFTGITSPYEPPLAPTLELRTDQETVEDSVDKLAALALSLARPNARLRYLSQLIGPESALNLAGTARQSSLVTVFAKTFEYVVTRIGRRITRTR